MKRSPRLVIVIGLLVIAGANYYGYRSWYAKPMAERRAQAEQVERRADSIRARTSKLLTSRPDLSAAAAKTLGRTQQTTEERLRSTLNELVRTSGLDGVRVDTRVDRNPTINPASDARLNAYRMRDDRGRMRATPEAGYTRIVATLTGGGPTRSVFDTIAAVESQQWLHRVNRLRLDPRDGGARAEFVLELETIFIPNRSPETGPGLNGPDPTRVALASGILERTPFAPPPPRRAPQPEVRETPPPVVVERPAPPPPYAQWRVEFLREGGDGPELTIRRVNSTESRRLGVGDVFHEMVFRGFDRLDAIFDFEGTQYRIGVGQNLATRDNPQVVQ